MWRSLLLTHTRGDMPPSVPNSQPFLGNVYVYARFVASRHPSVLRGIATVQEVRKELLDTFFSSGFGEGRVRMDETYLLLIDSGARSMMQQLVSHLIPGHECRPHAEITIKPRGRRPRPKPTPNGLVTTSTYKPDRENGIAATRNGRIVLRGLALSLALPAPPANNLDSS